MLKLNKIYNGKCENLFKKIDSKSIDLIFLDPPYFLQLNKKLTRPNHSIVKGVEQDWDKFDSFSSYDSFTFNYLNECKRVLKDNGSLWIIGSYHNIFRIGTILQNLDFWILNDVIWSKSNPLPNFRATRLTNAHETLIWCSKSKKSKYKFNYHALKTANEDTQERSIWNFPICSGKERIKDKNNKTAHPTQKPLSLMKKIITQCSNSDDLILEPFAGTGSFCAAAKNLRRKYIGFEEDKNYVNLAKKRLSKIKTTNKINIEPLEKDLPKKKIPFGNLIHEGYLEPGDKLYNNKKTTKAIILADGSIKIDGNRGSIHKVAAIVNKTSSFNGWDYWHYKNKNKELESIDELRKKLRNRT
ncbi:MAG: DNA methyltransferase [Pelagibacteraceae bacterium]|nr:DNA methyltransferase [Pelagibacteraceae bacterium]